MNDLNLDKMEMRVIETAPTGVVGDGTRFLFSQKGNTVSARYQGGPVEVGYLVGCLNGDKLECRWAQMSAAGRLDGGVSICDVKRHENGKLRIFEHFEWETRPTTGTNIWEEI
jgi:hypothetical protein